MCQILSVTCNNASSNDTMIEALAKRLITFPGHANWTQYFTHILNQIVKVILHQFDRAKGDADESLDGASLALVDMARDIGPNECEDENDDDGGDTSNGWVDPHEGMLQDERNELNMTVQPIWLVLMKVCLNSDHMHHLMPSSASNTGFFYQKLPDIPSSPVEAAASRSG